MIKTRLTDTEALQLALQADSQQEDIDAFLSKCSCDIHAGTLSSKDRDKLFSIARDAGLLGFERHERQCDELPSKLSDVPVSKQNEVGARMYDAMIAGPARDALRNKPKLPRW